MIRRRLRAMVNWYLVAPTASATLRRIGTRGCVREEIRKGEARRRRPGDLVTVPACRHTPRGGMRDALYREFAKEVERYRCGHASRRKVCWEAAQGRWHERDCREFLLFLQDAVADVAIPAVAVALQHTDAHDDLRLVSNHASSIVESDCTRDLSRFANGIAREVLAHELLADAVARGIAAARNDVSHGSRLNCAQRGARGLAFRARQQTYML